MEIGIWNQWRPGLPSGLKSFKSQLALHPSLLASPLKVYQSTRNDSLVCLVRINGTGTGTGTEYPKILSTGTVIGNRFVQHGWATGSK